MKPYKILKTILKNIGAFVFGAVLGALLSIALMKPLLIISIPKDVGLGIIGLAPVIVIFWLIVFGVGGGILGIVLFYVIKKVRKKLKK